MQKTLIQEYSSAVLIDTSGRLLLQRRDNKPDIMHPGKVSLFGGRRETGESAVECIVREISEEITYSIPADRFEHLISMHAPNPRCIGGHVRGEFFVAAGIPTDQLAITEGNLLIVDVEHVMAIRSELEPMTLIALDHFLSRRKNILR